MEIICCNEIRKENHEEYRSHVVCLNPFEVSDTFIPPECQMLSRKKKNRIKKETKSGERKSSEEKDERKKKENKSLGKIKGRNDKGRRRKGGEERRVLWGVQRG